MPSKDLSFRFHGEDVSVAATMAKITAEGEAQSKRFTQAFGKIPQWTTLIAVAGTVAVSKMAADFQSQMTLLQTAGGETQKNIGGVSDGILKMAGDTGTSTSQLAEGMYTVEKAGIRGADGLKVLKAAAEGAKAENVDLSTATNALTSVMMSYHLGADKAVSVQNQLVAGAGMAKTSMQEYAGSLSTVIPVASSAGIGFDQVAGAIATLTQHGTSAQESTQELANTIRSLQAPNHVAAAAMQQLGLNVVDVQQNLGKRGLTGTIELISDTIGKQMGPSGLVVLDTMKKSQSAAADAKIMFDKLPGSIQSVAKSYMDGNVTQKEWRTSLKGMDVDQRQLAMQFANTVNESRGFSDLMKSGSPAAQTFAGTLEKVMGGATGMNTALMLGGENMGFFKKATEEVGKAGEKSGADISTWAKTQATLKVQAAEAGQALNVLGIRIGTALLPVVTPMVKGIADWTKGLTENKPALIGLLSVIGLFAATMTTAYVAQKLMVTWTVLQKAAVLTATAVQWLWNVALDANPIGIIVMAIAGLVAGIVWFFTQTKLGQDIWKNFTKFLGEAWNNTVKWIGDACKWLHDYVFKPVFDAIGAVVSWLYDNVIKPVFDAIGAVFDWIYNNIIRPIVGLIVLEVQGWGIIFQWLHDNVIKPVGDAIGAVFQWLYDNVIQPIVGFIKLEIQGWGIIMNWLHDNVVQPVMSAIGVAFRWVHDSVIQPVVDLINTAIRGWGIVMNWLHDDVIKPVFDKVNSAFNWLHDNVIKPISDKINSVLQGIGSVFDSVFGGIGKTIDDILGGIGKVDSALGNMSGLAPIKPHAAGGVVGAGEISLVGERGPELVQLPAGTRVFPNGTGPTQQGDGFHIENFYALPSQSPAQIAAELGWRARWAS